MNRGTGYAFDNAPRCRARSERTGQPCRAPAMRGWRVCRFHGAGGGAPVGARNGLNRHGLYGKDFVEERRLMRALIREAQATLEAVDGEED